MKILNHGGGWGGSWGCYGVLLATQYEKTCVGDVKQVVEVREELRIEIVMATAKPRYADVPPFMYEEMHGAGDPLAQVSFGSLYQNRDYYKGYSQAYI